MLCGECGLEMRIVGAATRPEQDAAGVLRVWRVNEVQCVNAACARKGNGRELRALLWEGVPPRPAEGGPAE